MNLHPVKNWKTTLFGIATLAVYVGGYLWPEHKSFFDGLIPIMVACGLLTAKDSNVTGGDIRQ
ncbi:MAG TPA: hypothetical protein VLL97_13025 [Acidobacteriota bacterium]|nr:hypothetical protein [Acidobacteriota bacterium]